MLLTIGVEASALADWVSVLDVLPPATSKGVRPVLPNKERKHHKATIKPFKAIQQYMTALKYSNQTEKTSNHCAMLLCYYGTASANLHHLLFTLIIPEVDNY